MRADLKKALMIIAKENQGEYERISVMKTEDFLIKYELFIDEVKVKQEKHRLFFLVRLFLCRIIPFCGYLRQL